MVHSFYLSLFVFSVPDCYCPYEHPEGNPQQQHGRDCGSKGLGPPWENVAAQAQWLVGQGYKYYQQLEREM